MEFRLTKNSSNETKECTNIKETKKEKEKETKSFIENIKELKHDIKNTYKDNQLENMNNNYIKVELYNVSEYNTSVNNNLPYKLEVEQIGWEESAKSNIMKIKSLENIFLCKKHNKTLTKYINFVYILDKTTIQGFVRNMFIEKVLEENLKENLEELYKLFMEFPENLSAFEKLIESFSKDLSIGFGCNSVFRAKNILEDSEWTLCSAINCLRQLGITLEWIQCGLYKDWFYIDCMGLDNNKVEETFFECLKCWKPKLSNILEEKEIELDFSSFITKVNEDLDYVKVKRNVEKNY